MHKQIQEALVPRNYFQFNENSVRMEKKLITPNDYKIQGQKVVHKNVSYD